MSLTLNSVFIPMSILWLANISWYSSRMSSIAYFLLSVSNLFVQSNRFKNLIHESTSSFGFNSFSCRSCSSLRIRVCVGNQKVLFICSGLFVLSNLVKQLVKSGSAFEIILRIAVSTGLMNLDCSGVTTDISAVCVFFLI